MANPPDAEGELPLRVVVLGPPAGVTFAMQRGRDELVPPARATQDALRFDLAVRVGKRPGGEPNLLGPFAHGRPDDRFLYVNAGTYAGQAHTRWSRRAKVKLSGIGWEMIETVGRVPGAVLEARFAGTGKDGGPACATVPLLDGGWRVVHPGK